MARRGIQAQNTNEKLHKIGLELLAHKDFDDISVREICKKAGVSIGTFYNYYDSKSDILKTIHNRGDDYFLNEVKPKLNYDDSLQNIREYFILYIKFVELDGVEMLKHIYIPQNKFFIKENRPMHNMLKNIIKEGQEKNQISDKMAPVEIVNFIFIILRGIVFDWCLHDGQYDVAAYSENFIDFICEFIKESNN